MANFNNPITRWLSKYIAKEVVLIAAVEEAPKYLSRLENRIGSISRKFIYPAIDRDTLNVVKLLNKKFLVYPTKSTFATKTAAKYLPIESVNIPLRSKNPDIDLIAKEMRDSRNDMKNFVLSKFYRKLLRKNGINEKEAVQDTENNLDEVLNYVTPVLNNPNLDGFASSGFIGLNPHGEPKTPHYLHELTHAVTQNGTSKGGNLDNILSDSYQGRIHSLNNELLRKYKYALLKDAVRRKANISYFINPQEIQANLRPLLMLMVENNWQPKLMHRLIDKYNLLDNMCGNTKHLVRVLGKDGLADLLANMLKKGGKINK